jgi:DNA repair exonuclease SbcCD ATPase subunit
VILLLALLGVGAWALSLRSDNEDKDATIASQEQQLDEQQGVADQAREAASDVAGNVQQALSGLGDQIDEIQGSTEQTQEDAQAAIEQAETAAADARARAESAGDEADKAQAETEAAKADAEAAGACARGYLSAIAGAFDASSIDEGVAQARTEIEALSGSCSGILGS